MKRVIFFLLAINFAGCINAQQNLNKIFENFEKEYRTLNISELELSYVANLQNSLKSPNKTEQKAFFEKYKK